MKFEENTLYFGDCLQIMRGWSSECADLVYLDPPFNSDANYNNIFKGSGLFGKSLNPQVKAYEDIWTWSDEAFDRLERVKNAAANPASKVIQGSSCSCRNPKCSPTPPIWRSGCLNAGGF